MDGLKEKAALKEVLQIEFKWLLKMKQMAFESAHVLKVAYKMSEKEIEHLKAIDESKLLEFLMEGNNIPLTQGKMDLGLLKSLGSENEDLMSLELAADKGRSA